MKTRTLLLRGAGLFAATLLFMSHGRAEEPVLRLKIADVMTPEEMNATGVSRLSPKERQSLDVWLNRYTNLLVKSTAAVPKEQPSATRRAPTRGISQCPTAIESTIAGDFEGWSGETIFKLDNGQIWEQAEYSYTYSYAFRPEVTIFPTASGCKMKVEDEDEMILVRRIK